ncbi:3-dehydroquinate synthase [bacterium (Candidatus Blackallbacteria) CG17_big_fil_post_rev_8_21_14_2_50_48_46]|uniref:3-dehydroquinate synthase n=1 Tax=bacterium (Candidatus Blackallbacteria) CG17_big_fil_post_rev_8_21_14_2_50_48_46 TaxID=2014261 RepID=A0A2M7G8G9_9BACT|nr:MAG: 3-dehydroquinate synthase [bacterium (Candidatus Blackallbacteria) CG18_big_fil_WC_8_21_14_2_50_49_26]PIW18402.1 MAG: 3-dehydroquinate synthase [bacterium (Candidatus Blackallbacteria) CG17_big_fil_post_rev_8_21_14_2_50_48_46]PIW50561.1 MAG: 3-dehydroquinate synthase [bacterium (Candidatus Blackallbacteria) CG13_big_fil_rev_8_21_14_2_50_49_14]
MTAPISVYQKEKIDFPHSARSSEVWIGSDLLSSLPEQLEAKSSDPHVFLIADQALRTQGEALLATFESKHWRTGVLWVEVSEAFKDLGAILNVYSEMLKNSTHRRSWVLALGGGVIGDAAGFVAATYMRGLRWVSLPSTLLAQVDSGMGGKTGVNHPQGKNLIGAFHQPEKVICDLSLLHSLPLRDRVSGLGEMLKYGLIYDAHFFEQLSRQSQAILELEAECMGKAIQRCIQFKLQAVASDEYDLSGEREILNFGHTLGHALESLTDYHYYRHGEAVILGMWAALEISHASGYLETESAKEIQAKLQALPLPKIPAEIHVEALLDKLRFDKKTEGHTLRLILLEAPGQPLIVRNTPHEILVESCQALLKQFQA